MDYPTTHHSAVRPPGCNGQSLHPCAAASHAASDRRGDGALVLLEGPRRGLLGSVRLLDRYLLAEWAKVFTLCLLALGGIQILSVLYNYAPDFLAWDSDVITVLEFLALRSFGGVHLLVPISLLLSVIYVLGSLNRSSELAAIRAAGVGMWRLTAPLWAVGFVSAALLALAGAFLVPDAMEAEREILEREQFRALRSQGVVAATAGNAEFVSFENARARRLWLIARLGVTAGQAFEVTVHGFDPSGREVRTITARFAEFKESGGRWRWTFRDGRDLRFDPATGSLVAQPRFTVLTPEEFDEDPEVMVLAAKDPDRLSFREVSRYVEHAGERGTAHQSAYVMRYHTILSAPAVCLVVIAVAIPFSVTGGRVSPMVGVAKTFGLFLGFYFLSSVCRAYGESGAIPPVLAAWLPATLVAIWALPRLRAVD